MENKKKVFSVAIDNEGRHEGKVIAGKHLTIGETYDCDIVAKVPGLPEGKVRILEKSRKGYFLRIFKGMEGTITSEGESLSIKGLIESGLLKKKGGSYLFYIPEQKECVIRAGALALTLAYKEITVPAKHAVAIDSSFKKPWISREDYPFISILVVSAIAHFSTVAYLNTRDVKKYQTISAIERMPERFARLILEPPKTKVKEMEAAKPLPREEAKEEEKKEEKPEEKPEKEVKKDQVASKEEPSFEATKEAVRARVKSKGLLGVIMSKQRPNVPGGDVFARASSMLKNMDTKGVNEGALDDILSSFKSGEEGVDVSIGGGIHGKDTKTLLEGRRSLSALEKGGGGGGKKAEDRASLRARDEAEVYKTVRAYVGGLKYIYNNELRKDPTLKGKVTVKIVITPDGKVALAEIVSSTLASQDVVDAIIKKIYRWKFHELMGGEEFAITYTFDFSPVG